MLPGNKKSILKNRVLASIFIACCCFFLSIIKVWATEYTITPFTNNNYNEYDPSISNGQIVWSGSDGNDHEIYFYDGSQIRQLTNNNYSDGVPIISNGQIVWMGDLDNILWWKCEIFFYDGSQIRQLTNNDYYDGDPSISNGQIVWMGGDPDNPMGWKCEIFFYDGSQVIQLTNNNYYDGNPSISNGQIVWEGYDGNDYEIYLYDGSQIKQLTNNNYNDYAPSISNGQIVWQGYDGNDYEIYLATPGLAKKIPLGKSVSAFIPTLPKYKVYVPSRYGGQLQVKTTSGQVQLFYPNFTVAVSSNTSEITYTVPKDKFGWYYIKVSSATANYTIANTFYEEGEVLPERKPWNIATWWKVSDVFDDGSAISQIENTYDAILPKYDAIAGLSGMNSATEWEKGKSVLDNWQGHYIYNGIARETHAEKDWKYDWNHSGIIENPGPYDFYNSNSGSFGIGDGDKNDIYKTTWWGHCDGWSRGAIIYKDPDTITKKNGFTSKEVKCLFTELGMALYEGGAYEEYKFGVNKESKTTKEFHEFLREYISKQQKAIYGNLKAISRNRGSFSEVWNHPIWYYKAEMIERQNVPEDEKLVDVVLTLKAADDSGGEFREDSDRDWGEKHAEGGYGAPSWRYHLLFDASGDISVSGNGWDTYCVDDPNKLWYIPRLYHLGDFSVSYNRNQNITEQNIQQYVIDGSIKRTSW